MNPMLMIDGYKLDHRRQYEPGTTRVYSNWTPRSSRVMGQDKVVFFGLQYFLDHYLHTLMQREFFLRDWEEVRTEYQTFVDGYLGPNSIGTDHIEALWELGYVPLEFRALPEGTLCPLRCPAVTVENTHPDFAWLTNYIETLMSAILWMPCTSATSAYRLRRLLNLAARATGGDPSFVPWQGHDFSMRGMPGLEAATLSGMGHLLSFTGTDTIPAIIAAKQYYGSDDSVGMSVPATEHSVMSCGGQHDEMATYSRLLALYPKGIVSIVSDTWDLWAVLTRILPALKDRIMARDGKLVIRPDSGDPVKIICGDPKAPEDSPARKGVIELLWDTFGGTVTSTGHRQLDPHIGCIYGDAITFERAYDITIGLSRKNFASTNMVFGVGSFTYQHVTRDTYGFAMKATWAEVNGEGRDLFKKPVTDNGIKNSATGRLAVTPDFRVIQQATPKQEAESILAPVWRNGKFLRRQTFDDVRTTLLGNA